ncbi:MAG: hypothetical protein ACOY0T_05430 [Myxococcota bacterium]
MAKPRAAVAQDANLDAARELYEQGARAYDAGDFETAISAFERAYAISQKTALLFNIAQAERLAGPSHCERALDAYRRYLSQEPHASNAAEVEQRISEMRQCSEAEREAASARRTQSSETDLGRAKAPPLTKPAPAPPAPAQRSELGPLVTLGSGAALAVTGAVIYAVARKKFDEVAPTCPCPEGQFSSWERATHISYGLLALGGAAIAAGTAWWLIDTRQQRSSGYALGVAPSGVSISGRF